MRIVPRSLFGRLVLVLLLGLTVAQLLSLAMHMHEQGRVLAQASGMQTAQRIADIVRVLEPLEPAERRRMVEILSAPPLLISLNGRPATPRRRDDAEDQARAALFAAMLNRVLGADRLISVSVSAAAGWQPPPGGMRRAEGYASQPGRMDMKGAHMHGWAQSGISFIARVRLSDGTAVTFDSRQPEETWSWPYRLIASLAILLAAVLALSLLAVRWTTRPLKTLADAAEALGRDIDRPPLEERGPTEVKRAAHAFNTMQARLAGYVRDRTRVLSAMSHDLKTPITRLRLRAELLEDPQLRAKFEHDLREMETLVARTLDVLRGLESDESLQPVDVDALVQSLVADMRETGAEVEIEGRARELYPAKPQALKRCVMNLLDNSVQYGQVARVVIEDDADLLRIRVQDRGPGIPEAQLERVFDPFYRLEGSRSRDSGGTGLGLTIARSIAQTHGGTLVLRNRSEGGLEALLSLPRHTK
jgi:signal transduction histidine kinase